MSSKSTSPGAPPDRVESPLKLSPMAGIFLDAPVALPSATAPSLDGLQVPALPETSVSREALVARFYELKRAASLRRERAAGEALALGDDAQVDLVGYTQGRLIPFSIRFGLWLEVEPIPALPGLGEALASAHVGEALEVPLVLPPDYPVASLQGAPARFVVHVHAARALEPEDDDSPQLLARLGLGSSLDEAMAHVRQALEAEAAAEREQATRDAVLDEVARRSGAEAPAALVDEEIRRQWAKAEGDLLVRHGFSVEEQREALDGWLRDAATRDEVARRLRIGLALKALAETRRLDPSADELHRTLVGAASEWGLDAQAVDAAMRESKGTSSKLLGLARHLWMVDYVIGQAKRVSA